MLLRTVTIRAAIRHNWSKYYKQAVAQLESTMKRHHFHGDTLTKQIQRIVVHWQKKRTQYLKWEAAAAPLDEEAVERLAGRRVYDPNARARSRGLSEVSGLADPRDMSASPAPPSLTSAQRKQQIGSELTGFSAALPPSEFRGSASPRRSSPLKDKRAEVRPMEAIPEVGIPAFSSSNPLFRARSVSVGPSMASTSSSSTGIPRLTRDSRSPSVPAELAQSAIVNRSEGEHNPILMDDQDDYDSVRRSLDALKLYPPLIQSRRSASPRPAVPGSPSMRIAGSAKSPRPSYHGLSDSGYSSGSSPLRGQVA